MMGFVTALQLLAKDNGAKYHSENVVPAPFHTNTDIARLISETESTFTQVK